MDVKETTSILEDLYETLEDGKNGFSKAAEKLSADGHGELASKMSEFAQQRQRLAGELVTEARTNEIEIDTGNGTATAALHRGWMSMKDALTGTDPHAILAAAERGEDHAMSEYRKALEEDLPTRVKSFVNKQALEVKQAHDTVRALRDANA